MTRSIRSKTPGAPHTPPSLPPFISSIVSLILLLSPLIFLLSFSHHHSSLPPLVHDHFGISCYVFTLHCPPPLFFFLFLSSPPILFLSFSKALLQQRMVHCPHLSLLVVTTFLVLSVSHCIFPLSNTFCFSVLCTAHSCFPLFQPIHPLSHIPSLTETFLLGSHLSFCAFLKVVIF